MLCIFIIDCSNIFEHVFHLYFIGSNLIQYYTPFSFAHSVFFLCTAFSVYLSMQFFSSSLLFGGLVGFRVIFISHNMNVHSFCVVASFSLFARFLYCLCSSVRPTAAIPLETTNTIPCTTNILSLRFSAELQFSVSYLNYPRLNGTRIVYFCSICSAFKFCD